MNENSKNFILVSMFGFFSCVLLGLLFYGQNIFNAHDTRFQIVVLGLYGAIVYAFMEYKKTNLVLVAFILLIIGFIIHGKSISFRGFLMDSLLIASVFASIYFYKVFIEKNKSVPIIIRALVLMLLFALTNILVVVLLTVLYNPSANIINLRLLLYSKIPALVGISLGIGFDIYEILKNKYPIFKK